MVSNDGSINRDLYYSDNLHLIEPGYLKLSNLIINAFTPETNKNPRTSHARATQFYLNKTDFPPLANTVSKSTTYDNLNVTTIPCEFNVCPVKFSYSGVSSVKSRHAYIRPVKARPVNVGIAKSHNINLDTVKSRDVNDHPVNSHDVNDRPVKPRDVNTRPVKPRDVNVRPVKSRDVNVRPVKSRDVNTRPVKPRDVYVRPVKSRDVNVRPVKSRDVNVRPVKPRDVNVRPVKSCDVNVRPVKPRNDNVRLVKFSDSNVSAVKCRDVYVGHFNKKSPIYVTILALFALTIMIYYEGNSIMSQNILPRFNFTSFNVSWIKQISDLIFKKFLNFDFIFNCKYFLSDILVNIHIYHSNFNLLKVLNSYFSYSTCNLSICFNLKIVTSEFFKQMLL